jgi:hypothetical protein
VVYCVRATVGTYTRTPLDRFSPAHTSAAILHTRMAVGEGGVLAPLPLPRTMGNFPTKGPFNVEKEKGSGGPGGPGGRGGGDLTFPKIETVVATHTASSRVMQHCIRPKNVILTYCNRSDVGRCGPFFVLLEFV